MDPVSAARRRHTVQAYDRGRTIAPALFDQLREVLRLAPSSVNSQPWRFIVAAGEEGKARIARAAEGAARYNVPRIRGASHVIVLATRSDADPAHLDAVLAQEERDGRFADDGAREARHAARAACTDMHLHGRKDLQHWYEKQTYLALGTLLLAAAALDVGATPMEGFDADVLDRELGLREKGFTSTVIVALGYAGADDFNARLPKSRLPADAVFMDI